MKITHTAIATALAVAVVAFFFMFNGFAYFGQQQSSAVDQSQILQTETTDTTTMSDVTQLQVTDTVVGTGALAVAGDSVTVNYVGSFTDGTVFDASSKHPETANGFTFKLGAGQVIVGWDQGVAGMKVGGKRTLVVPSSLGYGPNDYGPIPGNSTLVFQVELLKVQK